MCKLEQTECEGKHVWLLVFAFISGALITLVYVSPERIYALLGNYELPVLVMIMLVLVAQLSLSVCGRVFLPVAFVVLGVLMALNANSAFLEFSLERTAFLRRLGFTALVVPLSFLLGVWGMENSQLILWALEQNENFTKGRYFLMHIVMIVSMVALALLVADIIFK